MYDDLFPNEIIENSSEVNFKKHSVKTKIIYTMVVLFTIAALVSLPFIETNVSIRSMGVIKPITERSQLTTPVSGKITGLYIKKNSYVERGQVVTKIASPILQERVLFNTSHQEETKRYLHDLSLLLAIDSSTVLEPIHLKTTKYQRSLLKFKQQVRSHIQEISQTRQKFNRKKMLYERNVISEAEYEQSLFSLQSMQNKLILLFGEQLNKWKPDQITYHHKLEELKTEEQQLREKLQQYIIKAPIAGTIQNMQGIYEGSYIYANQTLAEISPDTGLIAEFYVSPKDIGLIREGMKARIHVSSYDYNQWGTLTGKVKEISNDVAVVGKKPVFIVHSSLNQTYLQLKNGYRGKLKKGMTIQARFTVARRSLFQLLFDNVNDWLNPKWHEKNERTQKASM